MVIKLLKKGDKMIKTIMNVAALALLMTLSVCCAAEAQDEITFDNKAFVLKSTAQSMNLPNSMNEYFLKGENKYNWTQMLGVYHIPDIKDPVRYAEQFDNKIEKDETCLLLKFVKNKKTDQAVISYLENGNDNGKKFFTYNVYKYEKNPISGITEFRYAIKYFFKDKAEIISIANTVRDENDKYMTMLISSSIPPIVEKELDP